MKILEDMILERGIAVNEDILKVDSFVNHQVCLLYTSRCV